MAGDAVRQMKLMIVDNYIYWPNAEMHPLGCPRNVHVTGAFKLGRPPGGDFCP